MLLQSLQSLFIAFMSLNVFSTVVCFPNRLQCRLSQPNPLHWLTDPIMMRKGTNPRFETQNSFTSTEIWDICYSHTSGAHILPRQETHWQLAKSPKTKLKYIKWNRSKSPWSLTWQAAHGYIPACDIPSWASPFSTASLVGLHMCIKEGGAYYWAPQTTLWDSLHCKLLTSET